MRSLAAEPGYGNVAVVVEGLHSITDQGPADVVWTALNYHDLHNPAVPPDTALKVDQAVFTALKPGGVFLVEDHVGAPGTGASQGGTLHRIEPELRPRRDREGRPSVRWGEQGGRSACRPPHRDRV